MKRITWLPQLFLGVVFNAGALVGWAAIENSIGWPPVILYAGCLLWTLAYDTLYASLDVTDDSLIGIKSTARLWGTNTKTWVGWLFVGFYGLFAAVLTLMAGHWIGYSLCLLSFLLTLSAHAFWNPGNDAYTLRFFQFMAKTGFLLALAALAPSVF